MLLLITLTVCKTVALHVYWFNTYLGVLALICVELVIPILLGEATPQRLWRQSFRYHFISGCCEPQGEIGSQGFETNQKFTNSNG